MISSAFSEELPDNPLCKHHIKNIDLSINQHILNTEIACSESEKEYGLMNRKNLPPNTGMLFIFDRTQTLAFWMKNTLIDLSIAYVDKNWNIVDIHEMKANDLTGVISKEPVIFAIEANPHWFSKNKIKIGDKVFIAN